MDARLHPLLSGLSSQEARQLLRGSIRLRVPEGEVIHGEGQRPEALHLLLRGAVELTRLEDRGECGLLLLMPGDVFSLGAVMTGEPYLTSARALGSTTVLALPAADVRACALTCPALSARVIALLSGQWRMAVRHILDLKCRTASQRLAALLLRFLDMQPEGRPALLPLSRVRLAARLGIAPATLSRAIQQLADEGLVVRGRQVVVADRSRIERFCDRSSDLDVTERAVGVQAL